MTAVYPSGYNTFVPNHEATNRLVVGFSRNPNKFAINRYLQIVPVEQPIGYYLNLTVEECMRILGTDLSQMAWPDGNDAPTGEDGNESFEFLPFRAKRFAPSFRLGDIATGSAAWDMIRAHCELKAQQAMTARTQAAVTALTTTGNYQSTNTASTTTAGGGQWPDATTSNLYIKKSINYAVRAILQATGSVVGADDLQLVINPNLASEMGESQEIADFVKGSPFALDYIRGNLDGPEANRRFGLPVDYAGVKIVVEDAVKVTSKKGATRATSFVLGDATPFITARPGGLVGVYGSPSFSTGTLFVVKNDDMTVETKHDADNRRTLGRVVDHYSMVVTAPASGFAFTGAT
jgi:hypothetical protein